MNTESQLTNRIADDPALAAALGCAAGLLFSISFVGFASIFSTPGLGSIVALHLSSAILGGVASLHTLCHKSVDAPVLKVLRYLILAIPAFIVLQSAFGNEVYQLAGTTVSSEAFVGFRILMAATFAGFGLPIVEKHLAPADEPFEVEAAQMRYRAAIQRLASMDVAIEDSRNRGERQLAEFDRRLQMAGVEFQFDEVSIRAEETVASR